MCGISGILGPRPERDWHAWASLTSHRGPDALGVWVTDDAVLCHNRLSIIDLSTPAIQPDFLPEIVINRPKRGFNPPVWGWLKDNPAILSDLERPQGHLGDFIDPGAIATMLQRFRTNMEDNSTQLWSLLVLDRWLSRQKEVH